MNMHEPMIFREQWDKFKRWLRWAWWEVLLAVFAILMLHWFLINLDIVHMTVTQNGEVISEIKPTIRNYDFWEGGSYLSGPATRLPEVICSDDVTVELKYGFLVPNRGWVESFTVYNIDEPMFNPAARSEFYELESTYRSGRLCFDMDADTASHQVAVATATWYGILGKREVQYIFHLTVTD